jgi:hypothetical protein
LDRIGILSRVHTVLPTFSLKVMASATINNSACTKLDQYHTKDCEDHLRFRGRVNIRVRGIARDSVRVMRLFTVMVWSREMIGLMFRM